MTDKNILDTKILKLNGKKYEITLCNLTQDQCTTQRADVFCNGHQIAEMRHNGWAEGLERKSDYNWEYLAPIEGECGEKYFDGYAELMTEGLNNNVKKAFREICRRLESDHKDRDSAFYKQLRKIDKIAEIFKDPTKQLLTDDYNRDNGII